jgi:hypothetical protein
MGKVKEMYMDIQENAWEVLQANPTETSENLVGQVATLTKLDEAFITPIVQEVWDEYKDHGFNGDDSGYRYENENGFCAG